MFRTKKGKELKEKKKENIRATSMGVAIRGAIPITAKMTPQRQIIKLQWRWQNAIQGFEVTYLTTLERE